MNESATVVWDDGFDEREESFESVDVEELVMSLDGRDRTLVTAFVGDGHAACGGNARTGLVAYATLDGERFHQLVDGDGDGDVDVVAGGQLGRYPARSVVTARRAVEMLQWFVEHSELLPGVQWETS